MTINQEISNVGTSADTACEGESCREDTSKGRRRSRGWALAAATALTALTATLPAEAESRAEWLSRALKLQQALDFKAPLSQALWIGTHNSYNSKAEGYVDWNQSLSIPDQLREGVRELVLDVHWYNKELRLCHGNGKHVGCVAGDRRFKYGLRDIRQFLQNHNDEVIIVKIEGVFGHHENRFNKEIKNNLGFNYVYTPRNAYPKSSGCVKLEQYYLSKAIVRAAGKNVIIVVDTNKNLCKESKYSDIVFNGVSTSNDKFIKVKTPSECRAVERMDREKNIIRAFDTTTKNDIGSGMKGTVFLDGSKIDDFLSCGLNIFEMYNYRGSSGDKKEKFIWSWDQKTQEPDGSGGCAVVDKSSHKFRDVQCSATFRVACRRRGYVFVSSSDTWKVTSHDYTVANAASACSNEFGDYEFAAPRNKLELDMITAHPNAANHTVFINYVRSATNNQQWVPYIGATYATLTNN